MHRLHRIALVTLMLVPLAIPAAGAGDSPKKSAPKSPAADAAPATPVFQPPFPQRSNPFRQPDNKQVLAARRESLAQQTQLRLKGFVRVGSEVRAILEHDGELLTLSAGERRGDTQILEIAPPTLTLQRGRHRWTESIIDAAAAIAAH